MLMQGKKVAYSPSKFEKLPLSNFFIHQQAFIGIVFRGWSVLQEALLQAFLVLAELQKNPRILAQLCFEDLSTKALYLFLF